MKDPFAIHVELMRTFRFYIALTVFANLAYVIVFAGCAAAALVAPAPYALLFLIPPAMVSTGIAVLSAYGIGEAASLKRAIKETGAALGLPHVARAEMLPTQTALTFIFHALFSFGLYSLLFFALIGVISLGPVGQATPLSG
ncbi:MAG: hypothetical protein AAGJ94_09840 [Pseudomonadota bacterium]